MFLSIPLSCQNTPRFEIVFCKLFKRHKEIIQLEVYQISFLNRAGEVPKNFFPDLVQVKVVHHSSQLP